MKILNLKLRGSIGIKKGLGLDEIEIDFTQFAPGLIALTGKNGSGKTTILEQLHPYRTMVSRSGSLQSHFFLKDSYRILKFEVDNRIYESKILIDALTGGSEAYLFCDGVALNDGKLTTFDEVLEKVLGSQELFFNSVFSGQKSKGIAELKPADRRKLFYELLNLNVYDQYLETAKAKLKENEIKLAEIEGQINSIDVSEETKTELEEARTQALNGIAKTKIDITLIEKELDQINSAIRDAEIEIAKLEEKQKANIEAENQIKELNKKLISTSENFNSKLAKYNSDIEDSKKLIAQAQKLIERKEEIEKENDYLVELKDKLEFAKEFKSGLVQNKSEIQQKSYEEHQLIIDKSKKIDSIRQNLHKVDDKIRAEKRELEICQRQTSLINEVPCPEEIGTQCQFLKNAYESKILIETHENNIKELLKESEELQNIIETETKAINIEEQLHEEKVRGELNVLTTNINNIDEEIDKYSFIIRESEKYPKLSDQLKKAETDVKILTDKIENIKEIILEASSNNKQQIEQLTSEIEKLHNKIDLSIENKINTVKERLGLRKLEEMHLKSGLNCKKIDLDNFKRNLQQTEIQIDEFKKNEEKLADLYLRKSSVQNEIKDWTFLTKAFDKTGIPVLKLENSGIEITTIANELLSLFENKFRIVFETTSLTKDKKKLKETFDINIVEDDGLTEISNKSGGQIVWLETAIQSAISLVVRQQGRNIQTSFLDEKDGALDLENAYSYVEMIKKAHQMSGVHNTFIITHRSELLDFIPQQIKLADGLLSILN